MMTLSVNYRMMRDRRFKIITDVKQDSDVVINWVIRRKTERERNGIRWNFTTTFEELDVVDAITLIFSKYDHIQNETYI